ncbi:hypothetical protein [Hymenobacter sp. BT559]|uniref:hypothetical protein n=1 Tax=Hymenobacter sp. BT559 TaxID=2795729 RepID=UPI0018EB5119|nr:hypothetical protein [Hymenobacter sp. BT559]MBJ6142544.1 hypothetical protein [Hymenobacter sp. BT559]
MNQSFNLARFGRLLRKHTAEHVMSYALGAGVLLGGMLAVMGFLTYMGGGLSHDQQEILFTLFLLAAGTFFATTVLAEYGTGSRAALALMLPASQLEKYLVAWVFSLPVFLAIFVADFYLVDWLMISLSSEPDTVASVFHTEMLTSLGGVFLVVHGVALLGSISFRRQQFIKTGFLLFAAMVVLVVVNYQVLSAMVGPELRMSLPFTSVNLNNSPSVSLPEAKSRLLLLPLLALVPLLWAAAYARLTEKQL